MRTERISLSRGQAGVGVKLNAGDTRQVNGPSPLAVPFVVRGKRVSARGKPALCESVGGRWVAAPILDDALMGQLLTLDPLALADVELQDIISFLNRAGRLWGDEEYTRRRLWVRQAQEVLGYSERQARCEADWISVVLSSRRLAYDMLDNELGTHRLLDDWIPREDALVRAFPRGVCLHLLAGNVPLSGVVSVVRALLTKNVSILKASSQDLITPVSLALSFLDIDTTHPVAHAVNVVHWASERSERGAELARIADACCVWGSSPAVEWTHRYAGPETSILIFGPKRSLALVGAKVDVDIAASAIAHDVCGYDQAACFSTRQIFTELDPAVLVPALCGALEEYERLLPPGGDTDARGRASIVRLEEAYLDADVHFNDTGTWTVVVGPGRRASDHPLGRTLLVHPVNSLTEAYEFVDSEVQTVTVAPWEIATDHRDALARLGCSRIAEVGMANVFRSGSAHDGLYPLRHLVRLASVDLPASVVGKNMIAPINQTQILRHGRITDLQL